MRRECKFYFKEGELRPGRTVYCCREMRELIKSLETDFALSLGSGVSVKLDYTTGNRYIEIHRCYNCGTLVETIDIDNEDSPAKSEGE